VNRGCWNWQKKSSWADQLAHLLNLLPAGVVLLDGQGVIARVNQAAVNMLSVARTINEPLEGQKWRDLIRISFKQDGADGHEVTLIDGRKIGIALTALEKEPGQIILMTDLNRNAALTNKSESRGTLVSDGENGGIAGTPNTNTPCLQLCCIAKIWLKEL
jgi:two-component system sensor histidine kinase FlrB